MKEVFKNLNKINVSDKTEKKNKLTYLSWVWAWTEVKKVYPDANFEIWKDEQNRPYVLDPDLGYMVYTSVTIQGLTHNCWLHVMNGANKALKNKEYKYKIKEYKNGRFTGGYIDKIVEAATMADINKTLWRCLTENLALFGLGLYIYAKEDYPEPILEVSDISLDEVKTIKELTKIYNENINKVKNKVEFTKQLGIKRKELEIKEVKK